MIDPDRKKAFEEYMDEVHPNVPVDAHPFMRFDYSEIVHHPEFGYGIVTGFRMQDQERELIGLGIQFVENGIMTRHQVFTPAEVDILTATGIIFDARHDSGKTLEDITSKKA
jgi:hypothetical protein